MRVPEAKREDYSLRILGGKREGSEDRWAPSWGEGAQASGEGRTGLPSFLEKAIGPREDCKRNTL